LLVALLRRAAGPDQLWGLAALRELLMQGPRNLAAADSAGLNSLLIGWLQDAASRQAVAASGPSDAAAAGDAASPAEGGGGGERGEAGATDCSAEPQRGLLVHQLLALLRVSGGYSISGERVLVCVCVCCLEWRLPFGGPQPSCTRLAPWCGWPAM
jgi:hypothetical protein